MPDLFEGGAGLDGATFADALAGAGIDATQTWRFTGESALRHAGSPASIDVDLTQLDLAGVAQDTDRLQRVWREATQSISWAPHRIRLNLDDSGLDAVRLARQVRQAQAIGSIQVFDPDLDATPEWGWPMRVLYAPGTATSEVAGRLGDGSQRGWFSDLVTFLPHDDPHLGATVDFAFVADAADVRRLAEMRGLRVNALVYTGAADDLELWQSVRTMAEQLESTMIVVPHVDGTESIARWLERLVEEISHRNPIDVAVGKASSGGVVITGLAGEEAPLDNVRGRMRERYLDAARSTGRTPSARIGDQTLDSVPIELAEDVDDRYFHSESDGAHRVRELREANEFDIDLLPEPDAHRFLQAAVTRGDDIVTRAFAAGEKHGVHIWVGNGATGALRAETPAGEPAAIVSEDLRKDALAEVLIWAADGKLQRRVIRVGESRMSETASFEVTVAPDATQFVLNVALLLNGRVAQNGVIRGAATPFGGPPLNRHAEDIRFVVGPELADLNAIDPASRSEIVTLFEGADGLHEFLPPKNETDDAFFERGIHSIEITHLAEHFEKSIPVLVGAQSDAKKSTWLASREGARTFGELAGLGLDAYIFLVDRFANTDPDQLRAFTDSRLVHVAVYGGAESRIAVELLYDREKPDVDGGWCAGFAEALETGACPVCAPWSPDGDPTRPVPVCPAGFWGLRKQIERVSQEPRDGDTPGVLHNRAPAHTEGLADLWNVRVGISDRVDKVKVGTSKPTTVMQHSIEEVLHRKVELIRDWETWKREVGVSRPQLLVLLTHSEQHNLELGTGNLIDSNRIKNNFVRAPYSQSPPGPVVLLLGCDTATTTELNSFVDTFRNRGASVVVGTIGTTLGRYAAPIAGELVALLNDPHGPHTVGEALTMVRRRTMKNGWVTGLMTTAFTDGSYALRR